MLNENSTVKEMREFAAKAEITIPKNITRKKDILAFLKNQKPAEGPSEATLAENKAREQRIREETATSKADDRKRACKKPLDEIEKAYLAELEVMARSGHQPNTDQMRDLGILRERARITRLSVVEQNELAEMEVSRQAPDATPIPSSGVTEEERYNQLKKRSDIE